MYNNDNRGAIFQREKRGNEHAPDFGGDLELAGEVLQDVVEQARQYGRAKIDLSAWAQKDRNQKTYFSVRARKPYKRQQSQAPAPSYEQASTGQERYGNQPAKSDIPWEL